VYIPGSWLSEQLGEEPLPTNIRCALYARESSSENKAAMESQVDGLTRYAQAKGYQIVSVTKEFASGLNDNRKKLHNLIKNKDFDVLLVENKERLTRFGFKWFEALSPFKIEVINLADNSTNDLMEDLIAILTSFAARLYGQRRGRKKTDAAIKALQETE
jgi:predicted site-specific integrase-resolvase